MQPTVIYIDILFLLNLFLNYFILLAVKITLKMQVKRWRLFIGAFFGAVYACFMFEPALHWLFSSAAKLLSAITIVWISYGFSDIKSLIKRTIWFYGYTMLFGGIMLAVELLLSPKGMIYNNGIFYINISPLLLVVVAGATYASLWLGLRLFAKTPDSSLHQVRVVVNDNFANIMALADSGNMLNDVLTLSSVMVVDFDSIKKILPPQVHEFYKTGQTQAMHLEGTGFEHRFAVVPYRSVGNEAGLLPAFRPDEVYIDGKKSQKRIIIAVESNNLKNEPYSAIINHELI